MTWRPWVIVSAALMALIVNGVLLFAEKIPTAEEAPDLKKIQERLRAVQYLASNRRANFELMGMSAEDADATARFVSRFDRQVVKFKGILDDQAAELTETFCPAEQLPQPYSALRYLVQEENGIRRVVDPIQLRTLEAAPWYDRTGFVPALYDHFERTESRKPDATLMAVSAAILGRETDALDGVSPWSIGLVGTWGFSKLKNRDPRIHMLAIEYFALMHFVTEIANTPRGICS